MGCGLARHRPGADILDLGPQRARRAIGIDGHGAGRTAAEIGSEQGARRRIEFQVGRSAAAGFRLAHGCQRAALVINLVGDDRAGARGAGRALGRRIKDRQARMLGEPERVGGLGHHADRAERAGRRIEPGGAHFGALHADIKQLGRCFLASCRLGGCGGSADARNDAQHQRAQTQGTQCRFKTRSHPCRYPSTRPPRRSALAVARTLGGGGRSGLSETGFGLFKTCGGPAPGHAHAHEGLARAGDWG